MGNTNNSYVKNCYICNRVNETPFTSDVIGEYDVRLDGYVIIPKEQFLDDAIIQNIKENINEGNK